MYYYLNPKHTRTQTCISSALTRSEIAVMTVSCQKILTFQHIATCTYIESVNPDFRECLPASACRVCCRPLRPPQGVLRR